MVNSVNFCQYDARETSTWARIALAPPRGHRYLERRLKGGDKGLQLVHDQAGEIEAYGWTRLQVREL
jgi:hypothetical protein